MSGNTQVGLGPGMEPDEEATYRAGAAAAAADQAEDEADAMAAKLEGWKQALKDKKAEAKELRAEADRLGRGGE